MIYLDHAATTYPHESVSEAMPAYFETHSHNPSAVYATEEATAVADAHQSVAELLGAAPANIVFTASGSGHPRAERCGRRDGGNHVVTTTIEHSAVIETCDWLEEHGVDITQISPDSNGRVGPVDIEAAIRPETTIVSVIHANNQTGVVQLLEAIGEITADPELDAVLSEAVRVLDSGGTFVALLLNTGSDYVQSNLEREGSYFQWMGHRNTEELATKLFEVIDGTQEYFLDIEDETVVERSEPATAAMTAIVGTPTR